MLISQEDILKQGVKLLGVRKFAESLGIEPEAVYDAMQRGAIDYTEFGEGKQKFYQVILSERTLEYTPNKSKKKDR